MTDPERRELTQQPESAAPARPAQPRSSDTMTHVMHELQVHQIELEQQNEELRQAQVALDVARARYFDLYDLAPVGYCTLNEAGVVVQANLTAVTLLGLTRVALMGRSFARYIHPDDQQRWHAALSRLEQTGALQSVELRALRDEGEFWAQVVVTAAHDQGGKPERRVVMSDISALKMAETGRREGEQRYRDLFSRASAGIVVCSPDGVIIDVNEAFAQLHGWEVAELTGRNLHLVDAGSLALSPDRLRRLGAGEVSTFEVEHRHRAGHNLWLEASISQVSLTGSTRLLAFYREISERKRLHAGLAQNDRLASMGLLAAGVAHEINNPLVFVLSNVEILMDELPELLAEFGGLHSDHAQDLLERGRHALDGALRIKKITRALGTFSRVERSTLERIDVNDALEDAVTMANNEIKYRARLVRELGKLPPVLASEGKLTQVFLNLLINAAHAIEEGDLDHHRISLRTWSDDDEVFVEISDTGKGIAPENLERIFEPFFTTKALGVGSGLGLSICKNIMKEFGGDLHVESTLGVGTRFLVRLPASREVLTPAPAPTAQLVAPVRGRVLLVDDEPAIRSVMKRLLGMHHEVVDVASGVEAQALLQHDTRFDVILCDLMMPEMTGMALHAWLVEQHPALARRVVFVSGGAFTPTASAYLASVDNVQLGKPFDFVELKALVSRMIAQAPSP